MKIEHYFGVNHNSIRHYDGKDNTYTNLRRMLEMIHVSTAHNIALIYYFTIVKPSGSIMMKADELMDRIKFKNARQHNNPYKNLIYTTLFGQCDKYFMPYLDKNESEFYKMDWLMNDPKLSLIWFCSDDNIIRIHNPFSRTEHKLIFNYQYFDK